MATTIRLTTVILSSDSCQTKKQQLSDASSTAVRRLIACINKSKI
ncbi:hypothetical protein BOVAB4_2281 [Bacteroides ovatus]|nr:hypothetical protein BOVAB4_2281 [Bacteroides ovatus]